MRPFARLYGDRCRLVMRSPDDTTQNSAIGVNQCEFLYHPGKRTSSHNLTINDFYKSMNSAPGSSFGYGRPDSVKRNRHLKTHRPVCTGAVRNKGLKKPYDRYVSVPFWMRPAWVPPGSIQHAVSNRYSCD
jgi:hypothetical protein